MRPLLSAILLLAAAFPSAAALRISEFLASNTDGLTDLEGDTSDWIEIENTDVVAPADLTGWHLTDDAADLNKWTFPSLTVPPGGTVLVFASGKHPNGPVGELHANFSLNGNGEYLALVAPDGVTIATQFAPAFPPQKPDVSYGISRTSQETTLIHPHSTARFQVPTDGSLGLTWTAPGFPDGAWTGLSAGIGYQIETGGGQAGTPLAYWNFENTVVDQSGNGNNGTLEGAGYSSLKPPQVGGSRSGDFDGSAYVDVPIDVSEQAYTASMWVRTQATSGGILCVVDQILGGGGHDRHVLLNGGNIRVRTWNDETINTSGLNVSDGNWHHIAHVFGGGVGGQRIYVDGQLAASGSKAS